MKITRFGWMLMALAAAAAAQAPVEERKTREQAVQRSQQSAGAAYRDLQQASHEARLAEQDFLNAQDAQRAAQKQADESKRQMDAAKKSLDTARAKEAQARLRYEKALTGVDQAFEKPPAKQ